MPGSPSLPGTPIDSPTQLGEDTEVSDGTENGFLSDIEAAEPPQKKAREVKPRTTRIRPQQEEVSHSKKKLVLPPTSPAEVKQPKQSRSPAILAAASKATARRKPQEVKQEHGPVKQENPTFAEEVKQLEAQVKEEDAQVKEEFVKQEKIESDDDTFDYDNVLIPHDDDIWLCCPGGKPRWKAGQKKDARLVEWLNFARRQYVAKMKRFNMVHEIVFRKDLFKAMSTTNKSKFVNDMFTSKFMRTLTHTPSYIFPKYVANHSSSYLMLPRPLPPHPSSSQMPSPHSSNQTT